jgi:hypothetical protein
MDLETILKDMASEGTPNGGADDIYHGLTNHYSEKFMQLSH